jgi:hypothetical protein
MGAALSAVAYGQADARPDTRALSCLQAQALVDRSGAVVLNTGRFTYDRYVSSSRYCTMSEYGERAAVPTRDSARCPVGYICRQKQFD